MCVITDLIFLPKTLPVKAQLPSAFPSRALYSPRHLSFLLHGPHRTHPSRLSTTYNSHLLARTQHSKPLPPWECGRSKVSQANELTYCISIRVQINPIALVVSPPSILSLSLAWQWTIANVCRRDYCRRKALGVDPTEAFVACPRRQEWAHPYALMLFDRGAHAAAGGLKERQRLNINEWVLEAPRAGHVARVCLTGHVEHSRNKREMS